MTKKDETYGPPKPEHLKRIFEDAPLLDEIGQIEIEGVVYENPFAEVFTDAVQSFCESFIAHYNEKFAEVFRHKKEAGEPMPSIEVVANVEYAVKNWDKFPDATITLAFGFSNEGPLEK